MYEVLSIALAINAQLQHITKLTYLINKIFCQVADCDYLRNELLQKLLYVSAMRNSEHNKIRKGFRIISKVTSVFDAVNFTFSSSNSSVWFSDSQKKCQR